MVRQWDWIFSKSVHAASFEVFLTNFMECFQPLVGQGEINLIVPELIRSCCFSYITDLWVVGKLGLLDINHKVWWRKAGRDTILSWRLKILTKVVLSRIILDELVLQLNNRNAPSSSRYRKRSPIKKNIFQSNVHKILLKVLNISRFIIHILVRYFSSRPSLTNFGVTGWKAIITL